MLQETAEAKPKCGQPSLFNVGNHSHPDGKSSQLAATTMNSLYTLGVRQSSSIQADLERLRGGDASASLLGLSHTPVHALSPFG